LTLLFVDSQDSSTPPASRSRREWFILALIAGLMMDVYYVNAFVLFVLVIEGIPQYLSVLRHDSGPSAETVRLSNLDTQPK